MDDLRFHVLFNSILVILGRWADVNARLCAKEPRLQLIRFRLERGLNLRSLDQWASGLSTTGLPALQSSSIKEYETRQSRHDPQRMDSYNCAIYYHLFINLAQLTVIFLYIFRIRLRS